MFLDDTYKTSGNISKLLLIAGGEGNDALAYATQRGLRKLVRNQTTHGQREASSALVGITSKYLSVPRVLRKPAPVVPTSAAYRTTTYSQQRKSELTT